MKVLFLTYPRIGLNRGGLQIQIEETARGLAQRGVEVIFYDPWRNQIPDVDVCHVFSIDGAVVQHLERAALMKKPIVISPVFSAFAHGALLTSLKVRLSAFIPGMYSDLKRAKRMMELASRIIALNPQEESLIRMVFPSSSKNVGIVPNGIDLRFTKGDPKVFRDRYGLDNFVLTVGSIEPNKNQLSLIQAMKRHNFHLVIIGKVNEKYKSYWELCRKEGDHGKVLFVGELLHDDPLLASAYAAAKLFVLPSVSEVMPLSLYEAALSGCNVIASSSFPLQGQLEKHVMRFSPRKVSALTSAIEKGMEAGPNQGLMEAVSAMPSWVEVSGRIQQIYGGLVVG